MSETELDTLRRLNSDKAERLDACRKEGLRLLARANGLEAALREIALMFENVEAVPSEAPLAVEQDAFDDFYETVREQIEVIREP